VSLKRSDDADSIDAFTRDLGVGGLFAETTVPFRTGDRVEVQLPTPATWEPIVLEAEVCHVEDAPRITDRGVGLRFVEMGDEQAIALAEFVASLDYES
jgi:uncharacterized protein (TIGR02266 family)